MNSIKPDEFFKLVSVNSGISDLPTVKNIIYGMIKTISRELKGKQKIKIPDWGEFRLVVCKPRMARDVNDGQWRMLPAKTSVRFRPDYKVKKFFYEFGKEGL